MRVLYALAGTAGVVIAGLFMFLVVEAAMTGCDLNQRVNMVVFLGCMGTIAVLVLGGIGLVWWHMLR